MPIAQKDLAPHVRTQPWHKDDRGNKRRWHTHFQTKANTGKLCETKQNQRWSPIMKKQRNLGVRFEFFPLLEFSPPLERCSDIYTDPTSCLNVTLLFNVLFLWYFPLLYLPFLSIYNQSDNVCPVHLNRALFSLSLQDMPHYCWLAASVFWDMVRRCGQKRFSKITWCTFNVAHEQMTWLFYMKQSKRFIQNDPFDSVLH